MLALLNLARLEESVELSKRIIEATHGDTDVDYIFLGVTYWMMGKRSDAVTVWMDGEEAKYTDLAGGVEIPLLEYYAAMRLRDSTLEERSTVALRGKYSRGPWPFPLVGYILGEVDANGVLGAVSSIPALKAKQICQASFYFGVRKLRESDRAAAKHHFVESVGQGPVTLTKQEYYLAKYELTSARVDV